MPVDGPTSFTAGTLFPKSSKKTARAINAASGNRPLVVLANLSGFDGSPESLRAAAAGVRRRDRPGGGQLRRADRVLRGLRATTAARSWCSPATLNESMEVAAVEGSYASVIGGRRRRRSCSPGEVTSGRRPTRGWPTWRRGSPRPSAAGAEGEAAGCRGAGGVRPAVRSEKLGEVATSSTPRTGRTRAPHGLGAPDRPPSGGRPFRTPSTAAMEPVRLSHSEP